MNRHERRAAEARARRDGRLVQQAPTGTTSTRVTTATIHLWCRAMEEYARRTLGDCCAEVVNVARAVRRVMAATNAMHVGGCTVEALTVAALLKARGFNARAVAGEAVWRVGPGPHDAISCVTPENFRGEVFVAATNFGGETATAPGDPTGSFYGHAWVEIAWPKLPTPVLLDGTTATLRDKARVMDRADGRTTAVRWMPEVLVTMVQPGVSPEFAANGHAAGSYGYREVEALRHYLQGDIDELLAMARLVLTAGPEVMVMGPQSLLAE
jgi:hypothetical protein